MNAGESIVSVITNKNRNQIYRDLDSLDVIDSIHVDQGLEARYSAISAETLFVLLQNMTQHGTLRQDVVNKATQNYQKNLEALDKEIASQHKKESEKAMKKISKTNKVTSKTSFCEMGIAFRDSRDLS